VTRYSARLATDELGALGDRFTAYAQALRDAGWAEAQHWPYAYDRFENGVQIPELVRDLYTDLGEAADRFGDPFSTAAGSFYAWLNEPVAPGSGVTCLWHAVRALRPDLQEAFPEPLGADHQAFARWTETSGVVEHEIDPAFLSVAARGGSP
jgi:hypothetical protein